MAPVKLGLITDIQDFSVHDGYGIRTLIFFKGCPLHCQWCQNPECITPQPEIMFHRKLCRMCYACSSVCPTEAIMKDDERRVRKTDCIFCMECVNACKTSALVRAGYWKTVDEVLRAILEYNLFYTYSDRGGITLSGGEPTYQPDFASELLKACKKNGIHTAIETSGYCEHTALKKTVENCDLVLYDIKHMDEETHRGFTSRGNRLILDNLRMLVADDRIRDYVIRVPLIVGFNDSQENICETAEFVSSLRKVEHVDLLPFNELAIAKYNALGLRWRYENIKRQSEATLKILRECVEPYGLKVTIGGLW